MATIAYVDHGEGLESEGSVEGSELSIGGVWVVLEGGGGVPEKTGSSVCIKSE